MSSGHPTWPSCWRHLPARSREQLLLQARWLWLHSDCSHSKEILNVLSSVVDPPEALGLHVGRSHVALATACRVNTNCDRCQPAIVAIVAFLEICMFVCNLTHAPKPQSRYVASWLLKIILKPFSATVLMVRSEGLEASVHSWIVYLSLKI